MLTLRITALLGSLLVAGSGIAQENRNVSLNWVRAPEADGCTSAKSVAQRVQSYFETEHLLSEERFQFVASGSAHIAIEALVTRYDDGWQVVIGMSRGNARVPGSEFVQRSRSCEQLEIQAALVISQLLDGPDLAPARLTDAQVSPVIAAVYVVEPDTVDVSMPERPAAPKAEPQIAREERWQLMLGGALDRGTFDASALGVRVGASIPAFRSFPVELHVGFMARDGAGQFPNDRSGVAPAASVALNKANAAVLGCPANWQAGRLGIRGCAGTTFNAARAELRGFRADDSTLVSWLGLELAVRPSFAITKALGIWLEAGASITMIASPDFKAQLSAAEDDHITLYSAPNQTAHVALGAFYAL